MTTRQLSIFSLFIAILLSVQMRAGIKNLHEEDVISASIQALDHFMQASRVKDGKTAAKWMITYELHPPMAFFKSRRIMNRNESILSDYLSIDNDVYGYEVKRFQGNVAVLIEGAIRTEFGRAGEYSARLVYDRKRWRILDLDIDPM